MSKFFNRHPFRSHRQIHSIKQTGERNPRVNGAIMEYGEDMQHQQLQRYVVRTDALTPHDAEKNTVAILSGNAAVVVLDEVAQAQMVGLKEKLLSAIAILDDALYCHKRGDQQLSSREVEVIEDLIAYGPALRISLEENPAQSLEQVQAGQISDLVKENEELIKEVQMLRRYEAEWSHLLKGAEIEIVLSHDLLNTTGQVLAETTEALLLADCDTVVAREQLKVAQTVVQGFVAHIPERKKQHDFPNNPVGITQMTFVQNLQAQQEGKGEK